MTFSTRIISSARMRPVISLIESSYQRSSALKNWPRTVSSTHQQQLEAIIVPRIITTKSNDDNDFRVFLAAAGLLGIYSITDNYYNNKTSCNGIVGVVGTSNSKDAREFLLEGLSVLKHRGYDSAGMATMSGTSENAVLAISKYASTGDGRDDAIELVKAHSTSSTGHSVGIAHTRWATHGGKTDRNAHPHTDASGKIALVHNGTVNNSGELKKELIKLGYKFNGTTDSEVLAKLIGHYYQKAMEEADLTVITPSAILKSATENALSRCDGSWGLCVMSADAPEELVVACNGSPMMIGVADDRTFVASEVSAFSKYTKNFISMEDGEIGILHADARTLDLTRTQRAPNEELMLPLTPDPFPHWTLKEINEQPEAIARALGFGGRLASDKVALGGLDKNFNRVSLMKYVTLTACGSSLNAAKYGERIMKQLGSFERVISVDASEIDDDDFMCPNQLQNSGLIVLSQSGETKDALTAVKMAQEKNVLCLSVINQVGSAIARMTKMGVYTNAGKEQAVTSTKTFTTQVVALALIALWFRQTKDSLEGRQQSLDTIRLKEALMRLPISFGMALKLREQCKEIAKRLENKESCFVLGKGYAEPIAMEGAMKIKEMSYLHAEGYSGGALKHGPFALIENDETGKFGATPIIMFILDDNHAHHMRIAAEETKARGADLIIITDKPELAEDLDDNPLIIPNNGPLTALGAILPLQLIAYELAVLRGHNPDSPRNLSKTISSS